MNKGLLALAMVVLGYAIGALTGYILVLMTSTNTHDVAMEASMTAAFFSGPLGALIGVIVAWVRSRRG